MYLRTLFCSFVLLSSFAHAVPIEFRMDFEVQESGFDHPVGTTAFVSAIYDSDPPRTPALLPGDTSDWFQGESLSMGVGDEVFETPVKPSINVLPEILRIEHIDEAIIFVTGSSGLLPNGLPKDVEDFVPDDIENLFYASTANFGGGAPLTKINKDRGFELVGLSIGPVPEASGSMLLVGGAVGCFVMCRRPLRTNRWRSQGSVVSRNTRRCQLPI